MLPSTWYVAGQVISGNFMSLSLIFILEISSSSISFWKQKGSQLLLYYLHYQDGAIQCKTKSFIVHVMFHVQTDGELMAIISHVLGNHWKHICITTFRHIFNSECNRLTIILGLTVIFSFSGCENASSTWVLTSFMGYQLSFRFMHHM